ncbi:hypothetical protein [Limnoglobus roseus]|uniref:Scaffolding protein n=1 Tax=Limnoglobus roseus TaxID=2598579 RepID=A0A5C1AL29_9BACT|nr:hypothetical protein [Limnoglobus roseus]QEL19335.1 hypothetical protein PX52LOC_06404 [Limnoglobus roseus]
MTDTTETVAPQPAAPEPVTTPAASPEPSPESDAPQADTAPEQIEDSAPSDDPGDDSTDEQRPKKSKGGFQKRIDELTREREIVRIEKENLARELQAIREKERATPATATDPGAAPRIEDCATVEEFRDKTAEWGRQQARFEAAQQAEQDRIADEAAKAKQEQITRQAEFRVKAQKAMTKYSDWQAVAMAPTVPYSETSAHLVAQSEHAAELAYHLGKNPEVADRLARLDQYSCMREVIRLEARITAAPPPKPITKAEDPIKPVGGRETVVKTMADLAKSDDASAYIARMNGKLRKT